MSTRDAIRQRRRRVNLAARFLILIGLAGTCLAMGIVALLKWRTAAANLGPPAADLNPLEQVLLSIYLSARAAELTAPTGADPTPISFSVQPGASAAVIAEQLAGLQLVREARLLNYYLRYTGLDNHLKAGEFILRQTMTLPEIASALTNARDRETSVRIGEGWRLEQIAQTLSADPALDVAYEGFLALAGPNGPRPGNYSFLRDLPPGASLEGFLFPDTYIFRPAASASDVIQKMLVNFESRLPDDYQSAIAARGLTLYQAITIASLIEREAAVEDERPLIASVIFNRLIIGQPLEIDATVQYVLGTPDNWWPSVSDLDFRSIASPYNTYYAPGLPAGPIANPGLSSILAVAIAPDTKYLYYRAQCDGSGRHAFAETYEEHLANGCP
jgi:UPF0755 protein